MKTNKPKADALLNFRRDLIVCFQRFPLQSLVHLKSNFSRLIRGHYKSDGGGCIFHLLSERFERPIESRPDLINYFTGKAANESDHPDYIPAKHIVRMFDGDLSHPHTRERYPGIKKLGMVFLRAILLEAIEMRMRILPKRAAQSPEPAARKKTFASMVHSTLAFIGIRNRATASAKSKTPEVTKPQPAGAASANELQCAS